MRNFWLKLNLVTKVVFCIFLIVVILSAIGWLTHKDSPTPNVNSTDNSNYINKITNRNPILSYPVSYTAEWTGKIVLVPQHALDFEYAQPSVSDCGGITGKMDVYYTSDFASIMIIDNKNLISTSAQDVTYNNDVDIITGIKNFDQTNAELQSFRTYCSYFSLYPVQETNQTYPLTDNSRTLFGIGLRQSEVTDVKDLGLFVYVYAKKDDNIIQLSRSLQGSFVFTQANWDTCKAKPLATDQNKCLKNIYLADASMHSKIESEIDNLIKTFALTNGN